MMDSLARPERRSLLVECPGGTATLAARVRPGHRSRRGDLLLCLHGLGCAKESFESAFTAAPLADLPICAFDFPGHGGSAAARTEHTIEAYADLTVRVVRALAPRRLFLVAHSMGGAVGVLAAPRLLPALAGFVNIEGNLVGRDCGLVSRGAAGWPLAEFVAREFPRFRAALQASRQPALRAWAGWYRRADPVALHQAARSLVGWSDREVLLPRFTSLDCPAGYLYGAGSDPPGLGLAGMPVVEIPGSGHFPMVDNPEALWRAVAELLPRSGASRPEPAISTIRR